MKRVLIIEDDMFLARIYLCRLQLEFLSVQHASDGAQGLAVVAAFRPDVIVLDLFMPKIGGVDVIREVRNNPSTQNIPILVLSNAFAGKAIEEAKAAGASLCLLKSSATPAQVVSAIHELLEIAPVRAAQSAVTAEKVDRVRAEAVEQLNKMRGTLRQLQAALHSRRGAEQMGVIADLLQAVAQTSTAAIGAELYTTAHLAEGLQALLQDISAKPKYLNGSTVRTLSQTTELVADMLGTSGSAQLPYQTRLNACRALVVDDEPISRRAVVMALNKARLQSIDFEHPEAAWQTAQTEAFDLVITDIEMPGINGFELCQKLRSRSANRNTPVIFVTNHSGFESRKSAAISGGDDFIAKPFLRLELTVKALYHLVRSQGRVECKTFAPV